MLKEARRSGGDHEQVGRQKKRAPEREMMPVSAIPCNKKALSISKHRIKVLVIFSAIANATVR